MTAIVDDRFLSLRTTNDSLLRVAEQNFDHNSDTPECIMSAMPNTAAWGRKPKGMNDFFKNSIHVNIHKMTKIESCVICYTHPFDNLLRDEKRS